MSRRLAATAALLALALTLTAHAQEPHQPEGSITFTIETYQAELDRLIAALDRLTAEPARVAELRTSLAPHWSIATASRTFETDTGWLLDELAGYEDKKPDERAAVLVELRQRLQAMRLEAQASAQPSDAAARARLDQVLARPEFRQVEGPSALDRWKARVARFILELLDKMFSKVHAPPQAGQTFVWALIGLAAAVLAVWLYRRLRRREAHIAPRDVLPFAPSARGWRRWLADARAAAERGDWRDAVHLAYWAAISRLEESGAWVPDRARTPREYLRLLSEKNADRTVLTELTRRFEMVWYGNRPAGRGEFEAAVAGVERLQCRP
jgi:hypothetical protein